MAVVTLTRSADRSRPGSPSYAVHYGDRVIGHVDKEAPFMWRIVAPKLPTTFKWQRTRKDAVALLVQAYETQASPRRLRTALMVLGALVAAGVFVASGQSSAAGSSRDVKTIVLWYAAERYDQISLGEARADAELTIYRDAFACWPLPGPAVTPIERCGYGSYTNDVGVLYVDYASGHIVGKSLSI